MARAVVGDYADGVWLVELAPLVDPALVAQRVTTTASACGAEHVVLGPLLGAAGFRTLTDSLGRLTSQSALYIGLALLIVVYLMPSGILGVLDAAITPRFVWLQRAIVRADVAGRPKYR